MSHDPLCPVNQYRGFPDPSGLATAGGCRCGLIAKVREDERDKDLDYRYIAAQAEAQGQRDMLAKCIAAVKAVQPRYDNYSWGLDADEDGDYLYWDDALAALSALQEKP